MDRKIRSVNTQSTQALQKKIRSLKRFTTEPPSHVPATHLEEANRALATYQSDLKSLRGQRRNEAISQKYQMVRFFERKKAEKRLRQAQQALRRWTQESVSSEEAEEEGALLREAVIRAETDVEWVKSRVWDRGSRYIALYAGQEDGFSRLDEWWAIRKQLENGSPKQGIKWPEKIQVKADKGRGLARSEQSEELPSKKDMDPRESSGPQTKKSKQRTSSPHDKSEAGKPNKSQRRSSNRKPDDGRHRDKDTIITAQDVEDAESDGGFFE